MQAVIQRLIQRLSPVLFGVVLAAGAVRGDMPGFVQESLHSPNTASVAEIIPSHAADVVILNGGLEQGIRLGMVCRVNRGTVEVGELIIIESRSNRSAGLILDLTENNFIQAGDIARIKTLQNS
jgi:hypothetical protein